MLHQILRRNIFNNNNLKLLNNINMNIRNTVKLNNMINMNGFASLSLKKANILVVANQNDATLTELEGLNSMDASVVAIGPNKSEITKSIDIEKLQDVNVLLNCEASKETIQELWPYLPNLKYMHSRFAGLDHFLFDDLIESDVILSNAKGLFGPTLAEYVMFACSYFAKDAGRLMRQKKEKHWEEFVIERLAGKTMGIIGLGGIGSATAKLANAYGMKVIALTRDLGKYREGVEIDEYVQSDQLNYLMGRSDYVVISVPLTPSTRNLVEEKAIEACGANAVIINVSRGPVLNEDALYDALLKGDIRGAALDVFHNEPLPKDHRFWDVDNLLISPHCADMTATFLHESVRLFVQNIDNILNGDDIINIVDKKAGY